ncbi:hypothetical protein B0H10DRAFT_1941024 [Mycena sp. CBHHK59/15]|nr:hypothetical protein B0H10DRAFT_1941024 [Mycena sp. CBHHK59/15]
MAAEHSPLYRTITEQVSAYIDIMVTDPMTSWGPTWTGRRDELPMEILFDYNKPFPLPTGSDSILGISKVSDDHRITMQQVLHNLLYLPKIDVVYLVFDPAPDCPDEEEKVGPLGDRGGVQVIPVELLSHRMTSPSQWSRERL